jgi:hypothetical protein
MAEIMKIIAFWYIVLCSLVEVDWRYRGAYCLHRQGDDGGSMHFWQVGLFHQDYMVLYPRRL